VIVPINQAHKLNCAKTFAFHEARILSEKLPCFRDKMVNILGTNQLTAHFNDMSNYMTKYPQFFDGFANHVD
jgi:hypothetical protein